MSKRKILSLALTLCMVAILAVGGTLAYFVDSESVTNTFTVGNVQIELIESQLHRVNAGIANGVDGTGNDLWSNVAMEGTADGTYWTGACYTDDQIKADAENYEEYLGDGYIAPGLSYHKMPYVINTGANDAYIRIRVIIDAAQDALLDDSMYTGTAMSSGEFTYEKKNEGNNVVYVFTRVEPLAADEMTFWNVWGTVKMDADVTNEDITSIIPDGNFEVVIEADAIQADAFENATEAFAAFDAQEA